MNKLLKTAALFLALLATELTTQAATYSWTNNFGTAAWSNTVNWDSAPAFNNQADVVFNKAGTTGGNITWLGADTMIRSLTVGSSFSTANNTTLDIRNNSVSNGGAGTGRTLTFAADTGNASITVQNGAGPVQIRIGTTTTGASNTVLQSSVDVYNDDDGAFKFDGVTSGAGAINKYGTGVVWVTRANTFSGGVNVYEGKIVAWSSATALGSGTVSIGGTDSSTNATLEIGSALTFTNNMIVNSGTGARTIQNYSGAAGATLSGGIALNKDVIFNIGDYGSGTNSLTASGVLSGAGGVIKDGAGSLAFPGTNTFSGGININQGTLYLSGAAGTGAVVIAAGSTLGFVVTGSLFFSSNISGEGQVIQNGGNTYLSGNATHTGGTIVNGGNLRIGKNGTTGSLSGDVTVNGDGQLVFQRINAYTFPGTISGSGKVALAGGGVITLSGSNTYSGVTAVFASNSLIAKADGALGGSSNITVGVGATLTLTNGVANNYINDTATLILSSNSVLNLNFTGAADVVGAVSLDGGTNWLADGNYNAAALASGGGLGTYNGTGSLTIGSGVSTYTLTGSAGVNGTVSPTNVVVLSGGSTNFVITAETYYRIASLTTNGVPVAGMSFDNGSTATNFTWSNVQTDGTLVATFTAQLAADPAGTPYSWLAGYGLTNYDTDAVADQDLDGLKAWQEYIAGTDPTNKASCLKVAQATRNTVTWSAVAGRVYSVYWSTNLVKGFTNLADNIGYPQSSYTNTTPDSKVNHYQVKVRLE